MQEEKRGSKFKGYYIKNIKTNQLTIFYIIESIFFYLVNLEIIFKKFSNHSKLVAYIIAKKINTRILLNDL